MTYVYLNYYPNGYLYVGSHTWDGYGIDPNYIGSSKIACYHNWVPSQIEILETCSKEEQYEREKYWINHFCKCYGVCEQVSNVSSKFASQFKKGLLLNCHSNDTEQMHTPEVRAKLQATRKANGAEKKWQQAGTEAARAPEAVAKAMATKKANGSFQRWIDAANSPESCARRGKTRSDKHARRVIDQHGNIYKSNTDIGATLVCTIFEFGEYAPKKGKWKGYIFKPYVKNQETTN